jgi:hypothetical protein
VIYSRVGLTLFDLLFDGDRTDWADPTQAIVNALVDLAHLLSKHVARVIGGGNTKT